jgi:HK97 family phage portal protein
VPDGTGAVELVRVTDRRHSAAHERAFPRNPTAVPNDGGESGTVAPAAPAGEVMGTEHVHGMTAVPPTMAPPPVAMPWAGWPAEWGTGWQTPGQLGARVSTVFSCARVNAHAVGSMTPVLKRGRFPLPRGAEGFRSWALNPQPELYSDWSEFAEQYALSVMLRGNAYILPTSEYGSDGRPRTFYVRDPDSCRPVIENGVRRVYDMRSGDDLIVTENLLHLRYLSVPGVAEGLGPLQGAGQSLVSAAALEVYAANLARAGGIPWGVMESDQRLTPRQAQLARAEYLASRTALDGAPAFLPFGFRLNTLTLSPKDMALLELRVFDEQRIAGAFGVHPSLVNLPAPEGLTYSNRVDLRTEHHIVTLRPLAGKLANGLSLWALPGYVTASLNASEYVQGSVRDRVETYLPLATAVDPTTGRPILTGEELRELVGLPPGGDMETTLDALQQMTTGTQ